MRHWEHWPPPAGERWRRTCPATATQSLGGAGGGTWERHVEALDRFARELELGPVALVTHDWGVMIGLRWACDRPGAVNALAISDGGFHADRRWHDLANVMRTPGDGEQLIASFTREGLGAMAALSGGMSEATIDEYWKCFADEDRRRGHLELYRSGDFDKLVPYEGRLTALGLPALILWGEDDRFAGVEMAERFHEELPDSELVLFENAGHFVWDDRPSAPPQRSSISFSGAPEQEQTLYAGTLAWSSVSRYGARYFATIFPGGDHLGVSPTFE